MLYHFGSLLINEILIIIDMKVDEINYMIDNETRPWCIEGEFIQYTEKGMSLIGSTKWDGQLLITNHRIVFEENEHTPLFDIPVGLVLKIDKVGNQSGIGRKGEIYGISITTKDNNFVRLTCSDEPNRRKNLVESLNQSCFPIDKSKKVFAFSHCENGGLDRYNMNGWKVYDVEKEWKRLFIPSSSWVISHINNNYQLVSTYPRILVIPYAAASNGKEFIKRIANFRSKERFAVLSWIDNSSQATICRSSQPLPGVTAKKCIEDETYMKILIDANTNGHRLVIYDARPSVNATLNRAKGGGYEVEYDRCSLKFLNIQNIHVVRDSLKKLHEALFPCVNERTYLKQIDESRWLHHIQSILEGVSSIVDTVHNDKCSTLVHCSDGWDRTSQLTSLAMLCLDPYYRTLEGFAVLIEKEWCSFGHKFSQRNGQGIDSSTDNERSPIFIQFLDCVFQLLSHYSVFFEFNGILLIELADQLYKCTYGTFLFNNEKERLVDNNCDLRTISVWSHIMDNKNEFLNPVYLPGQVILFNPSLRVLKVWTDYYGRHNDEIMNALSTRMEKVGLSRALSTRSLLNQILFKQELASSRV